MQLFLLDYDVHGTEYPNPSRRLRSRAARISGSVWVVPEARIPYNLLHQFTEFGVTWHLNKFDAGDAASQVALAQEALLKEIEAARVWAAKSPKKAETKHEDSDKPERNDTFAAHCRAVLKRTERLLADLCKAAGAFGIDADLLPTDAALTAVDRLKTAAEARALCYAGMTEEAEGTDLAESAQADAIPAGVLADFIEERGGDVSGARTLFD